MQLRKNFSRVISSSALSVDWKNEKCLRLFKVIAGFKDKEQFYRPLLTLQISIVSFEVHLLTTSSKHSADYASVLVQVLSSRCWVRGSTVSQPLYGWSFAHSISYINLRLASADRPCSLSQSRYMHHACIHILIYWLTFISLCADCRVSVYYSHPYFIFLCKLLFNLLYSSSSINLLYRHLICIYARI